LRRWDYKARAVLFKDRKSWRLVDIVPPNLTDAGLSESGLGPCLAESGPARPVLGAAIDLGTTRVVLRLVNLATGENLGELGFDNPQIALGPDVLARIHHARNPEGLARLQALIIDGMNRHIKELLTVAGLGVESVYLFAGAGNTAMTHLFLGIEPSFYHPGTLYPRSECPGIHESHMCGH